MNKYLIYFLFLLIPTASADALFYFDGDRKITLEPMQTAINAKSPNDKTITFKNSDGQVQSLSSGIIIQFNKNWDKANIQQWAAANQLSLRQVLVPTKNIWLVNAPATVDSLHLANQLRESDDILAATPNWSRPLTTK